MSSLSEVRELVLRLYSPTRSGNIPEVQRQLQEIQRGPEGWQLASFLMNDSEESVRFFAALTFSVKLNQDGSALTEDEADSILEKLLSWFVSMVANNERVLVMRKVCSTMVTFYALPNIKWTRCVRNLHACVIVGRAMREDESLKINVTQNDGTRLNEKQLFALILFTRTFAEDMAKLDNQNSRSEPMHKRAFSNIDDVALLFDQAIKYQPADQRSSNLLPSYKAWVSYTSFIVPSHEPFPPSLSSLFESMLECFLDEDVIEATAETFEEILASSPSFIKEQQFNQLHAVLQQPWAVDHIQNLNSCADYDGIALGQLALALATRTIRLMFGTNDDDELSEPESKPIGSLMTLIHSITRSQTHESVEPVMANAIVSYWESVYIELSMISENFAPSAHLLVAIEELCMGIRLAIDDDEFQAPTQDDPMYDFRSSVSSFVQSAYVDLGSILLDTIVSISLSSSAASKIYEANIPVEFEYPDQASISSQISIRRNVGSKTSIPNEPIDMPTVEAAMFLLIGLADSCHVPMIQLEKQALQSFFTSQVFTSILDFNIPVPLKLRRLAIRCLGEFADFLQHDDGSLLYNALDRLFACLQDPACSDAAARSIYALCGKGRQKLVNNLLPFLQATKNLFATSTTEDTAKERTVASVAAIIEALKSDTQEKEALGTILDLVDQDYSNRNLQDPYPTHCSLVTLLQLKAIGEASQSPEDQPIDLDADEAETSETPTSPWYNSPVQSKIIRILQVTLSNSATESSVLQAACDVLKSGYRETEPGPFVFPPQVSVDLITSIPTSHERVDIPLNLATSFITSHASAKDPSTSQAITTLLHYTCAILTHLSQPSNDPEIAFSGLDLLQRSIPARSTELLRLPDTLLSTAFTFSIHALDSPDILPKRSAADLWVSILENASNAAAHLPQELVARLKELLAFFSPSVTQALVNQFGGNASRSDLERLALLLRQLIKHQMPALKGWLETALLDPAFPSEKVDTGEKRKFVAMVVALRGGRETSKVVKDFWVACRGLTGYG